MRTSASAPAVVYLHGSIAPTSNQSLTVAEVLTRLREREVLAAIARPEPEPFMAVAGLGADQMAMDLRVASFDGHVLLSSPAGPVPGPTCQAFVDDLAVTLGCNVELDEAWATGAPETEDLEFSDPEAEADGLVFVDTNEPEPALDVVLCRIPSDMLPLLARSADSALTAYPLESGWSAVRFQRVNPDLHDYGWTTKEGPVAALSGFGGSQYLSVLVGRGILPGQVTLSRMPDPVTTFQATGFWEQAFGRDRADLGVAHARIQAIDAIDQYGPDGPGRLRAQATARQHAARERQRSQNRREFETRPTGPSRYTRSGPGIGF